MRAGHVPGVHALLRHPRGRTLLWGNPPTGAGVLHPELRAEVRELLVEMHELYRRGYTPKVKPTKSCNACSLKELCLPKLMKSRAVSAYLRAAMEESP